MDSKKKNKSEELLIPLVLLAIGFIMLIVSSVFSAIALKDVIKSPSYSSLKLYPICGLIASLSALLVCGCLIGLNYVNYSAYASKVKGDSKRQMNTTLLWLVLFISSLFSLISSIAMLLLAVKIQDLTENAYINSIVSSATSMGALVFILISGVAYGFTTSDVKKYLSRRNKFKNV